jgi:hypothetical protein
MALFIPSSQLLIAAGDSQTAQKFILSSREWFDLQNHVQALLALPSNFGEYEQRYGDASSGLQMKECFDAMHVLQNVASKYGNPKSLRANILQNPNFLANAQRPRNDAYSATLWTLQRAHQDAFSLASQLRNIPTIAVGEQPSEVVAGIKSLFLDADQIVDKMRHTVEQLDVLVREFQTLEDELNAAQVAMKTYTQRSSNTRKLLDKEIGSLKNKIEQLERDRDAAYDKWLALTISASVVPAVIGILGIGIMILLAVPTGGGSFAVGSAVTAGASGVAATALGVAASNARTSYDNLVQEVSTNQEFLQKRSAYRHDLGALDDLMQFTLPSVNGIISQIQVLKQAWTSSIDEIQYKVNDLSIDNLTSGPWLKTQEMAASADKWLKVDNALKAFMNNSFVDSELITFGSSLPQDDPNWQQNFALKLAA